MPILCTWNTKLQSQRITCISYIYIYTWHISIHDVYIYKYLLKWVLGWTISRLESNVIMVNLARALFSHTYFNLKPNTVQESQGLWIWKRTRWSGLACGWMSVERGWGHQLYAVVANMHFSHTAKADVYILKIFNPARHSA